ncbi:hypothetical protein [Patiriisocius marinus]|uniref:Peptidase M56 domain-containing protein n=1 Tax=Patiriisocius marinus TaxID=1397112 RepID=A0A5J4ITW7_9FLAO|nr:hypothetical protein [Patiriisocius marinus]GER57996.1 hypothetical protein ULMA_01040 [Patiriisocius marinus]
MISVIFHLKLNEMIPVVNRFLIHKYYNGVTVWPFVLMRHKALKDNLVFMNHEKIHLRQQIELLVLPFYIWYLLEFIVRLFQYKNWDLAYRNISFEREAYANEKDLNYIKKRPFWVFRNYL